MLITESKKFKKVKEQTNRGRLMDKISDTGRNAGNTFTDLTVRYEVARK